MPWITNSVCGSGGGTTRPWGLKKHNKKLYVGVVCDQGLTAHVYCYDFRTAQWNTTPRLSFPLNYTRQPSSANANGSQRDNSLNGGQWHAWEDNYNNWTDFQSYGSYAQPILSDIEFDDNGDMIIGLMDRGAIQMGYENLRPAFPYGPGGTTLVTYVNAGDILRAGLNDTSADPAFTIENDGITQGIHKTKVSTGLNRVETISHHNDGGSTTYTHPQPSGPGGKEFYWGDRAFLAYDAGFNAAHYETALGALAVLRGSGELIATEMDPQYQSYVLGTQGIHIYSNTTGELVDAKRLSGNAANNLYKAVALGDIEFCCDAPPIEIGNFVWIDLDKDGIQDPCEPPLPNVTMSLYEASGSGCCTYVSSTNTDADGQYYFDNLDPNTTADSTQVGNTTDPDNIDSDGTISSTSCCADGHPTATVTTGEPGEMNYSLDFGFFSCDADAGDITTTPLITDFTICKGEDLEDGSGTSVSFDSLYTAADEDSPGSGYDYVFILANTSGEIITYQSPQADFDFTTLAVGTYNIYGLSYDQTNSPNTVTAFLGSIDGSGDLSDNDIAQIRDTSGFCLDIDSLNSAGSQVQVIIQEATATASADATICNGSSTNLTASGGTTYAWSPSTGLSDASINNPVANPTDTTTYIVTVTDANGCTGTDTVVVAVNPLPVATAVTIPATCPASGTTPNNDGTIKLTSFPAGATYQYSAGSTFNSGAAMPSTAATIPSDSLLVATLSNPSSATDYTIRVYLNGCQVDVTVSLSVTDCSCIAPILASLTNDTICIGESFITGNITTSVTNSVGVTYQWYNNNGTDNPTTTAISGQTTGALTALPTTVGSYSYKVVATSTTNNSCTASQDVNLVIYGDPSASVADVLKCTDNTETIEVSPSGGTGPFTYNWSGPSGGTLPSTASITTGVPGTYQVTVTDANGCTTTATGELTFQSKVCLPATFTIRQGPRN